MPNNLNAQKLNPDIFSMFKSPQSPQKTLETVVASPVYSTPQITDNQQVENIQINNDQSNAINNEISIQTTEALDNPKVNVQKAP